MINFIFSRFSLTVSSMLVLPVLSISFSNDNGSNTAKGMSFLISSATFSGNLSAYGADIKKSILSEIEPTEEIEVDVRRMHAGCLKFGLQLVFGLHCSLA